jgi:hypothetical protein
VEETGLSAAFYLRVQGCDGKTVPVDLYALDASGAKTFLMERPAKAVSDDSRTNQFTMTIPLSRFSGIAATTGYEIYVRSPEDHNEFIGKQDFTLSAPFQPGLIWSWKQWEDQAQDSAGNAEFKMTLKLAEHGYNGSQFQSVVLFEDAQGHALTAANGSPVEVQGDSLNTTVDDGTWENLVFEVPYAQLSHLNPASIVFARPTLKTADGALIGGNVYFKFLAGGGFDAVYDRLSAQRGELNQEIQQTQDKLKALGEDSQ